MSGGAYLKSTTLYNETAVTAGFNTDEVPLDQCNGYSISFVTTNTVNLNLEVELQASVGASGHYADIPGSGVTITNDEVIILNVADAYYKRFRAVTRVLNGQCDLLIEVTRKH